MGHGHPFRPARAEGLTVDKQGGFPAHIQGKHDGLPLCLAGKRDAGAQPQVFPCVPPRRAFGKGGKRARLGLLGGQMLHGGETFKLDFFQRLVKILRQNPLPVGDTGLVF